MAGDAQQALSIVIVYKWHACLGSYKENVCSRDVQEGKVLGKDDVDGDGLEMVMANVS